MKVLCVQHVAETRLRHASQQNWVHSRCSLSLHFPGTLGGLRLSTAAVGGRGWIIHHLHLCFLSLSLKLRLLGLSLSLNLRLLSLSLGFLCLGLILPSLNILLRLLSLSLSLSLLSLGLILPSLSLAVSGSGRFHAVGVDEKTQVRVFRLWGNLRLCHTRSLRHTRSLHSLCAAVLVMHIVFDL